MTPERTTWPKAQIDYFAQVQTESFLQLVQELDSLILQHHYLDPRFLPLWYEIHERTVRKNKAREVKNGNQAARPA